MGMLTLGRIFTPILSCLVVPPCTLELLTECKKKLLPLPHLPSRLRLLLPQKGSTLYGLEVLSLPRSQPSNRCGSRNKNMTNLALELYTENASKLFFQFSNACQRRTHKIHLQIYTFIINVIWIKNPSYHVLQTTTIIF